MIRSGGIIYERDTGTNTILLHKKKKLAVGLTAAVAVLALATGVYAVLPMVNAANESGSPGKSDCTEGRLYPGTGGRTGYMV